jgi:hypothetical protein
MVEMDTMGSVGRITDRESMALQREPMKTGIRRSPNHSSGLLVLLLLGVLSQAASGQREWCETSLIVLTKAFSWS